MLTQPICELISSGDLSWLVREDPPWQTYHFDLGRPVIYRMHWAWSGYWVSVDEFAGEGSGWSRLYPLETPAAMAVVSGVFAAETSSGAYLTRADCDARLPVGATLEVTCRDVWRSVAALHGPGIAVTLTPRARIELTFAEKLAPPIKPTLLADALDRVRRALDLNAYRFRV
jgi:hypothetical protein